MADPVVSVVLEPHHCERFTKAAVESVLAQSLNDFELLLIGNEATGLGVENYRGRPDPRIRVISGENRNHAAARNNGIREARGRYIAFLDGSDAWMPRKLKRHVEHLDTHPDVGVSYSYAAFIDEKDRRLGHYRIGGASPTPLSVCATQNPIGGSSGVVIRSDVFNADHPNCAGGEVNNFFFDEELDHAESYELWVRIASQTRWQLGCIPLPLTLSRIHAEGPSSDIRTRRGYHYLALVKIFDYAPEVIEKYRTTNVAYLYWRLARHALLEGEPRGALEFCRVAWRFNPSTFSANSLLLVVSAMLQEVAPAGLNSTAERLALRGLGKIQERSMKRQQRATAA